MEDLKIELQKLQNVMKKDPESYSTEFNKYFNRFKTLYELQVRNLGMRNPEFITLMTFLSSVIPKFSENLRAFFDILYDLISTHGACVEPQTRFSTCLCLFKLRKFKLINLNEFIDTLIKLIGFCESSLRSSLIRIIVKDIKVGIKNHDQRMRNNLINIFNNYINNNINSVNIYNNNLNNNISNDKNLAGDYNLSEFNAHAQKRTQYACLTIMRELWRRSILRNDKTANIISFAAFSNFHKVSYLALISLKGLIFKNKEFRVENNDTNSINRLFTKNKGARVHLTAKTKKKLAKKLKKLNKNSGNDCGCGGVGGKNSLQNSAMGGSKAGGCGVKCGEADTDTAIIRLIYSPEKYADRLFSLLKAGNKFEYRILVLEVLARVISIHELLLPNFYQYCLKYLKPHQENVIKILTAIAQSIHKLVPQDFIQPVIETICNNFISLQVAPEICSVGINSIREIYSRAPLNADKIIVNDLVQYSHDRKADKSVVSAARSLIQMLRKLNPEILSKKYQMYSKKDSSVNDSDFESIGSDEEFSEEIFSGGEGETGESGLENSKVENSNEEIMNIENIATVYGLKKKKQEKEGTGNNKVNPYKGWRFNKKASTTNMEKKKNKAFFMAKNKYEVKKKKSRSYKQRAASLKKSLLKQQKVKKRH